MRKFNSGASRNSKKGKYEYHGFFSPLVLWRFAQYMHKHRKQDDGSLRPSNNWKQGIPVSEYFDSLLRHTMDVWAMYEGNCVYKEFTEDGKEYTHYSDIAIQEIPSNWERATIEDALCGIIFNSKGYLYEQLKKEEKEDGE